ncbi:MAG: amidohydrolase [Lachnospiraceae bacterium]|nr:amidohydrolase [Lachnospiraceae bacterium]
MKKQEVFSYLASQQDFLNRVSDEIWDHPETCFEEAASAEILCKALEETGFTVERGVAGIATAFTGTYGHGKPVIGFLGEFDALSGLSQVAGSAEKCPLENGANGHGCGHNLLGVGCLAGAMGMKKYLEETGKEGTVIFYGCPAEEGGSGKAFMAREGCFDVLDAALAWHPGPNYGSSGGGMLANCQIYFRYKGVSSHAAMSPHLGRSALDAVTLFNVGIQFLREHVLPTVRMHYAVTDTGGFSPNVVQPTAEVLCLLRAPDNTILADVRARVEDIARGAALMTGTELEIDFVKACSNVVPNNVLGFVAVENLRELTLPKYSEEEMEFYSRISATNKGGNAEHPISETIPDFKPTDEVFPASSDVGDVSWVAPTVSVSAATWPVGTAAHSWQAVSVGKSSLAHNGMLLSGQAMAGVAIDLIEKPELLEKAKAEHNERLKGGKYECPIPKGVKPRIISNKK